MLERKLLTPFFSVLLFSDRKAVQDSTQNDGEDLPKSLSALLLPGLSFE